MIMVNDKNRDDIIRSYVHRILGNMNNDALYNFAYESMVDSKDLMDNVALENEILDYYPDVLEN
jgi:hypothetical protein